MLVYTYDEDTKEFLGSEDAHLDPLETKNKGEDVYLLPAFATFEKPLDKVDGKAIVFDDSTWKLVDDYRGKFTIKDNSIEEIKTLDPVEKVLTDEEINGLHNGTLIIVNNEVVKKPAPTREEVAETRKQLYTKLVDPLTSQISRLKDEPQTEELVAEIETLKVERSELVTKIKEENPYPNDSQMEQLELPLYV